VFSFRHERQLLFVPATGVRINPICRRFLPGSALGAKFEVVVRGAFAIEVTLRHHRVAFQAKMFMSHRCRRSEDVWRINDLVIGDRVLRAVSLLQVSLRR
jgi:hypothetical protein